MPGFHSENKRRAGRIQYRDTGKVQIKGLISRRIGRTDGFLPERTNAESCERAGKRYSTIRDV
jgi:hypothetical protein